MIIYIYIYIYVLHRKSSRNNCEIFAQQKNVLFIITASKKIRTVFEVLLC